MLDMIALAFQSDTTRISTFMFGNAVSGVNFRFLEGVTDSHHEISHHSQQCREAAPVRHHQSLARGAVRLSAAQAPRHEGRRALGSGQLDDPVRVGAQRRELAQSAPAAAGARRTRRRTHRVRTAPGLLGGFALREPVRLDARRLRNPRRAFRRQHRSAARRPGVGSRPSVQFAVDREVRELTSVHSPLAVAFRVDGSTLQLPLLSPERTIEGPEDCSSVNARPKCGAIGPAAIWSGASRVRRGKRRPR